MTAPRARLLLLLVALVASLLLGPGDAAGTAAPARKPAPAVPPGATRVWAPCVDGPGTLSVTVYAPSHGVSRVTVVGRNLVPLSHWRVRLSGGDQIRRTAIHCTWQLSAKGHFRDVVEIDAVRGHRGPHGGIGVCSMVVVRAHPAAGGALCLRGFEVMVVRRVKPGKIVVRYLNVSPLKHKVWHIALTASSETKAEVDVFNGRTNRKGVLRSRLVFRHFVRPHFQVKATSPSGRVCRLRLNPAEVDHTRLAPRQLVPARFGA